MVTVNRAVISRNSVSMMLRKGRYSIVKTNDVGDLIDGTVFNLHRLIL